MGDSLINNSAYRRIMFLDTEYLKKIEAMPKSRISILSAEYYAQMETIDQDVLDALDDMCYQKTGMRYEIFLCSQNAKLLANNPKFTNIPDIMDAVEKRNLRNVQEMWAAGFVTSRIAEMLNFNFSYVQELKSKISKLSA
jgi:hypothetical protein